MKGAWIEGLAWPQTGVLVSGLKAPCPRLPS